MCFWKYQNFRKFSGHVKLNLSQHLGAVPPDPHFQILLSPQFQAHASSYTTGDYNALSWPWLHEVIRGIASTVIRRLQQMHKCWKAYNSTNCWSPGGPWTLGPLFTPSIIMHLSIACPTIPLPSVPVGQWVGEGWGFDQPKIQIPHRMGKPGDEIPPIPCIW